MILIRDNHKNLHHLYSVLEYKYGREDHDHNDHQVLPEINEIR
jgi:hypothetical protein